MRTTLLTNVRGWFLDTRSLGPCDWWMDSASRGLHRTPTPGNKSRSAVFLDTTSNLTTPEDEGDDDDDELRQCAALEPMFLSAAKKQVGRAGAHRDDDGDETRHSLCQASAGWRGSIRVIRDRAKPNSVQDSPGCRIYSQVGVHAASPGHLKQSVRSHRIRPSKPMPA